MNLRTLKKRCKQAVEILIAEHGYRREHFTGADGDESVYAPANLEKRYGRHGFVEPGLLKGTPVHWYRCSYESDEWDIQLPTDMLADILMWKDWKPSAADVAEWDAFAAKENAAIAARANAAST